MTNLSKSKKGSKKNLSANDAESQQEKTNSNKKEKMNETNKSI